MSPGTLAPTAWVHALRIIAGLLLGGAAVLALSPDARASLPECSSSVCNVNPETLELDCRYQANTYCGFTQNPRVACVSISRCVPR